MLLTHRKRNVRVWRFWRPGCPVNGRQKQAATRRVRRVNSEPSLPTPDPWFEEDDLQTACYRCLGCKILNQGREMNRISSGRILFNVIRHRTWRVGLQFQLYEALQIFSPASLAAKTISYFQWCLPFMIAAWCCLRLGSEEPRWHGQKNGCLPNRSRKCLLQDFDIRCFPKSLHCLSITKFRCRGQHQNMSLFFCFALATCRVILCHSMERSPPLPCTMFFSLALLCLSECFRRDGVQRVTACKVWAASLIRSQLPPMSTCNKILRGRFGNGLEAPDIALPWWWFEIIKPTIRIKKEDEHHGIMIIWYMICLPYTVYHIKCVSDDFSDGVRGHFLLPGGQDPTEKVFFPEDCWHVHRVLQSQSTKQCNIYNIYPLREWWNFPCWEH